MFWGELISTVLSNDYARALIILVSSLLVAKLLLHFFKHYMDNFFLHFKKVEERKLFSKIELPVIIVIILVGFQLSIKQIIESNLVFENFLSTIMVFVITFMFMGVISIVLNHLRKTGSEDSEEFHDEMFPLINSLAKILLILIAVIVIMQIWKVQVGPLLASLGIAGAILGFAFKDSLVNIFGGIALASDGVFKKKDVIRLDSGEIGEVIEMGLRSTKIKTFNNEFLIIPNGLLANTKFVNLAQPTNTLRIVIPVSVAYGSNVEQVHEVLLSAIKGRSDVLKFPKREVRFIKMSEYSLDFELIFFISDYKTKYQMINEVTTLVYNSLFDNNIEIPFPTRTVYNKVPPKDKRTLTNSILPSSSIKKTVVKKVAKKKRTIKKKTSKKRVNKKK